MWYNWYFIDLIPLQIGISTSTRCLELFPDKLTSSNERVCRWLLKSFLIWFRSCSSNLKRTRRIPGDIVAVVGKIEIDEIESFVVGCVIVKFVWDDDESVRDYLYKKKKKSFISISKLSWFNNDERNCSFLFFCRRRFSWERKNFLKVRKQQLVTLWRIEENKIKTNPEQNEISNFTSSRCNGIQIKLNLSKVALSNVW